MRPCFLSAFPWTIRKSRATERHRVRHRRRRDLRPGGESGAGKSTIALAILRLLEMRGGRVRGREIALVPQSPLSALNPALRFETHFREAWRAHSKVPWADAKAAVRDSLCRMALPTGEEFLRRHPGQISVGQAQRVVIAMAVLHQPRLLIADEPSSALDAASRTEALSLFRCLNRDRGTAILYISHDLASIAELCQRSALLESGGLVIPATASPRRLALGPEDRNAGALTH